MDCTIKNRGGCVYYCLHTTVGMYDGIGRRRGRYRVYDLRSSRSHGLRSQSPMRSHGHNANCEPEVFFPWSRPISNTADVPVHGLKHSAIWPGLANRLYPCPTTLCRSSEPIRARPCTPPWPHMEPRSSFHYPRSTCSLRRPPPRTSPSASPSISITLEVPSLPRSHYPRSTATSPIHYPTSTVLPINPVIHLPPTSTSPATTRQAPAQPPALPISPPPLPADLLARRRPRSLPARGLVHAAPFACCGAALPSPMPAPPLGIDLPL